MTDILGDGEKILLVTGDYYFEGYTELHPIDDVDSIKGLSFNNLTISTCINCGLTSMKMDKFLDPCSVNRLGRYISLTIFFAILR